MGLGTADVGAWVADALISAESAIGVLAGSVSANKITIRYGLGLGFNDMPYLTHYVNVFMYYNVHVCVVKHANTYTRKGHWVGWGGGLPVPIPQ